MKEAVEKFLKEVGVDGSIIESLKAETMPEDFSIEEATAAFIEKRKQLTLADSEVMKGIKAEVNNQIYPAIMKSTINSLKKLTGITDEEIKAQIKEGEKFASLSDIIPLALQKNKSEAAKGKDELNAQLHELRSNMEALTTNHQTEVEKLRNSFQMERKQEKIDSLFFKQVSNLDLVLAPDVAQLAIKSLINKDYILDTEDDKLVIKNKDGSKAQDGKNFLTASDIVTRIAAENKILKVSNGGGVGGEKKTIEGGEKKPLSGEFTGEAAKLLAAIEARDKK